MNAVSSTMSAEQTHSLESHYVRHEAIDLIGQFTDIASIDVFY